MYRLESHGTAADVMCSCPDPHTVLAGRFAGRELSGPGLNDCDREFTPADTSTYECVSGCLRLRSLPSLLPAKPGHTHNPSASAQTVFTPGQGERSKPFAEAGSDQIRGQVLNDTSMANSQTPMTGTSVQSAPVHCLLHTFHELVKPDSCGKLLVIEGGNGPYSECQLYPLVTWIKNMARQQQSILSTRFI